MKRLIFRIRLVIMYPLAIFAGLAYPLLLRIWPTAAARLRSVVPRLTGRGMLAMYGMPLKVLCRENLYLAEQQGCVLFTNHNSRLDPYVLFAALPFAFKSFWSSKAHVNSEGFNLAQWYGQKLDLYFLHDKKDIRRTATEFRKATDYVRDGGVLSFFPEGRFSQDGKPGDFGVACSKLAIRAGVPIIPMCLEGSEAYFEQSGQMERGEVLLRVGRPISTEGLHPSQAQELSRRLEMSIVAMRHGEVLNCSDAGVVADNAVQGSAS